MKDMEFSNLEEVSTQVQAVNYLLATVLDDLFYFGKLNPLSDDSTEQMNILTLCDNLPKGQALLYLALEKMNEIQKEVDSLEKNVRLHPLQEQEQPVA